jgi:hypothetical protein
MSAFLSFVGGAAGEYNRLTEEERLAKKKAAADKAAVKAEEEALRRKLEIEEQFEIRAGDRAREQQTTRFQEKKAQLVPELEFLTKRDPKNIYYFSSQGELPTIESFAKPENGYVKTDAFDKAKELNSQLADANFAKRYFPVPPKNPTDDDTGWTIDLLDVKDQGKSFLAKSQDQANGHINDGVSKFKEMGYTDNDINVKQESTKDGIKVTVSLKTGEDKKAAKPTYPLDANGVPTGPHYLYKRSYKVDTHEGNGIISLKPNGTLNRMGIDATKEIEYDPASPNKSESTFFVYRRAKVSDDKRTQATEGATYFFSDFSPDVVKRIVDQKDTNPAAYDETKLMLSETLQNWKRGMAVDTGDGGQRIPPIDESFGEQLNKLAELDPGLRQVISGGGLTDQALREINYDIGEPINNPVMIEDDGGALVKRRPNLADAFAVEVNGEIAYQQDFVVKASGLAKNGQMQVATVYDVFNSAVNLTTGLPDPEAVTMAYKGAIRNTDLLTNADFSRIDNGRKVFSTPTLASETEGLIVENLSRLPTHQDRITSLQMSIPDSAFGLAEAQAIVGENVGRAGKYESVTGRSDYDDLTSIRSNAERVMSTGAELEALLVDLDGDVGIVNQVTLLKKGANYLFDSVVKNLKMEDGEGTTTDQLRQSLNQELTSALATEDEEAQVAALVRLNVKIQTYAYASMLDPNGRLSDQDRQQAELAIGAEGISANPDAVLTTSRRLVNSAARTRDLVNAYTSGNTKRVIAADYYGRITGGLETDVVKFMRMRRQDVERNVRTVRTQGINTNLDLMFGVPPTQQPADTQTPPSEPRVPQGGRSV